jgi:hypothetical protein
MNHNQSLTITIKFKVEHTPGDQHHLEQIVENYLRPKGVVIKNNIIEI